MKALILAAGRGARMGGLTTEQPKCLVPLGGKTLLEWQTSALRQAGMDEIGIVTGYKKEVLESRGFFAFHNPRWFETNMVMSLAQAALWLRNHETIISYSDIVYHPDSVRALMTAPGPLAMTYDQLWESLWRERFADPLSDAETFTLDVSGNLTAIGEKPRALSEIQGQYMGLLKFKPEGWRKIEELLGKLSPQEQNKIDMTKLIKALLGTGEKIQAVPVQGRWCEVDSESDLLTYENRLKTDVAWKHDWRFV